MFHTRVRRAGALLAALLLAAGILGGALSVRAAEGTLITPYLASNEWGAIDTGWARPKDLDLMSGWQLGKSNAFTVFVTNGSAAYCIEPGVSLGASTAVNSLTRDEYWNGYPESLNETIPPDVTKFLLGQVMLQGYNGAVSTQPTADGTGWFIPADFDRDVLSKWYATQILIWETIVGERDADFSHVAPPAGKNAVKEVLNPACPSLGTINSYYNSIVTAVKNALVNPAIPSFMNRKESNAQTVELAKNGAQYTASLTDTNGVLEAFSFSTSDPVVTVAKTGSVLKITASRAIPEGVLITASRTITTPQFIVWTDRAASYGEPPQAVITLTGQQVTDTLKGYVKAGSASLPYDPVGILLQKKDAQSQDDVRPVAL
ncbi:MAG: thioester domain-containing protein [Lachnospiraceae bacterium]|nr:thioester domain-containing protein [Lachnospiraceae bacterium]